MSSSSVHRGRKRDARMKLFLFASPLSLVHRASGFTVSKCSLFTTAQQPAAELGRSNSACRRASPVTWSMTAPSSPNPQRSGQYLETPVYKRIPVIGFLVDLLVRNMANIHIARQFGPVYEADAMGKPTTVITDLDGIGQVLKDADTFRSTGGYPPTFPQVFGEDSLLFSDGHVHSQKRKTVAPAFSSNLFPSYFDVLKDSAAQFWLALSADASPKAPVDLKPRMNEHYLRAVIAITMGLSPSQVGDSVDVLATKFVTMTKRLLPIPTGLDWLRAPAARDELLSYLKQLILTKLREKAYVIDALREEQSIVVAKVLKQEKADFITVLAATSGLPTGPASQDANEADLEELARTILLIWFAGFSTQANATVCCIMEMLTREACLTRLQEEQSSIEEITVDVVMREMPLLDSFISEVMRLWPPAAIIWRKAAREANVCGHRIAEGTVVTLDMWSAQRNEKVFEQPDELVMDRFLSGEEGTQRPLSTSLLLSFGSVGGPHYCLGAAMAKLSMKTTLAVMIRDFDVEVVPWKKRECTMVPDMVPVGGVKATRCSPKTQSP